MTNNLSDQIWFYLGNSIGNRMDEVVILTSLEDRRFKEGFL
jgi:hypothetical protein